MGQIQVNRLTNGNIYIDGNSRFGQIEEVTLPEVKTVFADHKALGMNGKVELPSGIDKMTSKMKFNSVYPNTMAIVGDPFTSHSFQFRGNLETYNGSTRTAQQPYVVYMEGTFRNYQSGNVKQHENVEIEAELNVTYVKVEVNGVLIMEVDTLNNIMNVNGVDLLATYRANLGI
jgi:P2 family phage contractile tail tube protein